MEKIIKKADFRGRTASETISQEVRIKYREYNIEEIELQLFIGVDILKSMGIEKFRGIYFAVYYDREDDVLDPKVRLSLIQTRKSGDAYALCIYGKVKTCMKLIIRLPREKLPQVSFDEISLVPHRVSLADKRLVITLN